MAERTWENFVRSVSGDKRERCNDIHVVCGRQHIDEHCLQGAIAEIVVASYSYLAAYECGTDDDLYEAEKRLVDTLKAHKAPHS